MRPKPAAIKPDSKPVTSCYMHKDLNRFPGDKEGAYEPEQGYEISSKENQQSARFAIIPRFLNT